MKCSVLALSLLAAAAYAFDDAADGKAWWAHVASLADDSMEGRKAATEGHRKAARYVAEQFEKAGLKPAGTDGYMQPVGLQVRRLVEKDALLELLSEDKVERLQLGQDAILSTRGQSGQVVEADAVFIGHGLTIPEHSIDDLKGLDLKGKIAVVLPGAPKRVPGPLASHSQSNAERWKHLRAAGVIGIFGIPNLQRADVPWARTAASRLSPSNRLSDADMEETPGVRLNATINPRSADKFLAGTGHTVAELLAADKADTPLPKFPLKVRIRAKTAFTEVAGVSENVLGMLPGTDPQLKNEYVVYSAHLDHLGIGQPVASNPNDRTYNGAMDNASGIASMIEVAKALKGKSLKRSVLFAAVTAEEGGLLGSRYFAQKPTVAGQIVADINTDMFLPIIPLKALTVYGLDESDLGKSFAEVSSRFGVSAKPDPEPHRNIFIRSDQYSFIRKGIPSLTFKFHADLKSPEHATMAAWLKERYHAPSDDLAQPVNIEGAVQFNRIMVAFVEHVASQPVRPVWNESSFFRRFAK